MIILVGNLFIISCILLILKLSLLTLLKTVLREPIFLCLSMERVLVFFNSSHGLRQDDPLSSALFVIANDYLSRYIANMFELHNNMFFRTKGGLPISHLCFADDFIIFMNASRNNIRKLMDFFQGFYNVSGLPLNNHKCCFFVSKNMKRNRISIIKDLTGFMHGQLPIKYLGIPLFKCRKYSFLFNDLISSVQHKLMSWESNFLRFGDRLTLIKSVLCSLHVYSFQTLLPTKGV
ncbi:hypothetical protein MA16_Dca019630 [Dendrobium catenatum]|uniref:Reverse transcriptase domain-containing protein n=1 Tax=Dendrobium catenatum TaxID=906689 RepID=A0A2I0V931_9ASPA|nr:hypothetical protein MA16_Dca019630 [Dendrobium catenatum]